MSDSDELLAKLEERFAKGEISEDTYREMRANLEAQADAGSSGSEQQTAGASSAAAVELRERRDLAWEPFSRKPEIASADIIAYLAEVCRKDTDTAAGAVDAFWSFVADPDNHTHSPKKSSWDQDRVLVVPRVGTFYYGKRFGFRSTMRTGHQRPRAKKGSSLLGWLFGRSQDPEPVAQDTRSAAIGHGLWTVLHEKHGPSQDALSVKRRIALFVAAERGIGLESAHTLVWELTELLQRIFECSEQPIRWAKRGVMKPRRYSRGRVCYWFRPYRSFSNGPAFG